MERGPATVTDVRSSGRGSKRRIVWLDGEPWRPMPIDVVRELGITTGDTIDIETVETSARDLELRLARERALRLLAYKERSESDVRRRLLDDGYSEDVADETVAHLLSSGLIDDRRFAEALARSLVTIRGLGRVRALRDLAGRGVSDDLARDVLDALVPEDEERERARSTASRLLKPGDTRDRLAARLVRRGFAPSDALDAARHRVADEPEPDE